MSFISQIRKYRIHLLVLAGSCLILFPGLRNPLQTDEAYTYLHFASKGPVYIFGLYNTANNHILHSLFVWFFSLFGQNLIFLRLTAFLSSIGLLLVTFLLTRKLIKDNFYALLSAILLIFSFYFYSYSWQARGYNLCNFLVLLSFYSYIKYQESHLIKNIYLAGIFSSLAVAALPTAIWVAIAFWAVVIADRQIKIKDKIFFMSLNGLIITIFYLQIIIYYLFINKFSKTIMEYIEENTRGSFVRYYLFELFKPLNLYSIIFIFIFSIIGFFKAHFKKIIFIIFILSLIISQFTMKGYVRNYAFIIPIVYVLFSVGTYKVFRYLKLKRYLEFLILGAIIIFLLFQAAPQFKNNIWEEKIDYARQAAYYIDRYLSEKKDFYILVDSSQVEYYMDSKLKRLFEETKRIPLAGGLKRIKNFLDRGIFTKKLVNLIPELQNRISIDKKELDFSRSFFVIESKIEIDKLCLGEHLERPLEYLGRSKKNTNIISEEMIFENKEYRFLKIKFQPKPDKAS